MIQIKNTKTAGKLHCPECDTIFILIDNEIVFCPGCELSSRGGFSFLNEEECQKRTSSIIDLNYNKSSCS
ncbi:MAG: hypothetical protein ACFFDF_03575 [Candidatus Odinarchaeota archaeon]